MIDMYIALGVALGAMFFGFLLGWRERILVSNLQAENSTLREELRWCTCGRGHGVES